MKIRTITETMFGGSHATASGILLVALRVLLGLQFLVTGVSKIFSGWTAEGYLNAATGPFADFFKAIASSTIISELNVWGLALIGLALVIGLLVRPAAFFGALLMVLYYFAHFVENTAFGLIDYHVIYFVLFALMASGGFGHALGIDGIIFDGTRGKKWWRFILFG